MRTSSAALTVAGLAAGLTAAVVLRRRADRGVGEAVPSREAVESRESVRTVEAVAASGPDAVVLPFLRSVAPAAPAAPARCGDSGGRTKSGAPCAARPSTGGRCHHHPRAARATA